MGYSLLFLGVATLGGAGGSGGALALDASGASSTVGRVEGEVDVLLRVEADDERGDVDDLLADADVALADQDAGVVDRLGQSRLEDLGLEAALEEVLDLEGEDVIEAHALLVEDTDADETADEGVSLEEALGVLLVELEELTGRTADLGQDERDAPDLALVAEAVLSSELELGVQASRLERTARDLEGRRQRTNRIHTA